MIDNMSVEMRVAMSELEKKYGKVGSQDVQVLRTGSSVVVVRCAWWGGVLR